MHVIPSIFVCLFVVLFFNKHVFQICLNLMCCVFCDMFVKIVEMFFCVAFSVMYKYVLSLLVFYIH